MMNGRQAAQELNHCFDIDRVYEISRYHPPNPSADDQFYAKKDSHGMWQPEKIGSASHLEFVFNPKRYEEHPMSEDVADQRTMLIRIKRRISSGGDKNAQTLLVTIVDWTPETHPEFPRDEIVVRFFDPLFIIFDRRLFGGITDVVYEADHAHSHESAALSYLTWLKSQPPAPGDTLPEDFFPHFYGSWTTNFTSAQEEFSGKTRPVRLILTEYIDGINMTQMCKSNMGDFIPINEKRDELPGPDHPDGVFYHERRMAVLKKALDGIQRLKHNGIMSVFPIRPWYIMIEGGWKLYENDGPLPRIIWVNFTKHVTGPFTLPGSISYQTHPKPLSPAEFFDMRHLYVFNGWLPMSWREHPDHCKKWLQDAFKDGDYVGYDVTEDLTGAYNAAREKIRSGESSTLIHPGPHTRGLDGYASIPTLLS